MYYLLYGLLYTFSLLPWKVLYLLSDGVYLLVYYIIGYRREVVMNNLLIAFPEKTEQERVAIAKQFYHSFLDTFIETIKFLSVSDKEFSKRLTGNFEVLSDLYSTGQNIQLHSGHFFNWEYMNWGIARNSPYPLIGVYAPVSNKAFDKIILKMRSRYKGILVSTYEFKTRFHQLAKNRYALALMADQNPGNFTNSYWVSFLGRKTPFITGPEKSARINNTAIVFANFYKVKRGYYNVQFQLFTTSPRDLERGESTKKYAAYIEACIRKRPANYLWSHKRWKYEFKEEYRNRLYE
ncbi:lysophospholipid acyltransferase family protein [Segetibacter koreensis]|uniref:lysophospholipid acyltransferase family protein n=1 Tax=Segetibacter koreensis TaxID=398037 RepID=UPI00036BCDD3|nr:lysophospholipid acyltransferase family protein [Segetibacter koreensis]